jgi:hypothetical protein
VKRPQLIDGEPERECTQGALEPRANKVKAHPSRQHVLVQYREQHHSYFSDNKHLCWRPLPSPCCFKRRSLCQSIVIDYFADIINVEPTVLQRFSGSSAAIFDAPEPAELASQNGAKHGNDDWPIQILYTRKWTY